MKNLEQIEKSEEIPELEAKPDVAFNLTPIRHRLRARAVTVKGESRRDFNDLCNSLELEWSPRSPTEQFYVEQMAVSQWKLHRMQIIEYDNFFDKSPSAPGQISLLERLMQCQVRLERSYAQAQRDLQRLQKTRPRLAPAPPEEIVFTPDPPRNAEVIDISTGLASTEPEDAESPTTHHPPPTTHRPTAHRPTAHRPTATGAPQ